MNQSQWINQLEAKTACNRRQERENARRRRKRQQKRVKVTSGLIYFWLVEKEAWVF